MKKLLLLTIAVLSFTVAHAQIDNPKFDLRDIRSKKQQGHQAVKPFIYQGNDNATTFDPTWADRFQTVLDSIMAATGAKGASIAVYTPEEGIWTGVSGTSDGSTAITPDMRFGIGSNTKLFIAVVMVRLQEEGVLTLDDHLYQWLPSFQYIDSNTTIRQLLTHQSGIWDYWNDSPSIFDSIWSDTSRFWTTEEIINSIGPPHFAPGNGYRYSNTNYVLAGMIIEAATGETWVQKLHDFIFDPLDLDSTFVGAFEPRNGPVAAEWDAFSGHLITKSPMTAEYSQANACGAMLATAAEMVQWYDAMFTGSVLSDSSLHMVLSFDPSSLYGLGIQEGGSGVYCYYHTGGMMGYVSMVMYDSQRKATICLLFNDRYSDFSAKINALFNVFFNEYPRRPNDASIADITGPWEHHCSNIIIPEVVLFNNGINLLNTVSINYRIDDDEVSVFGWTGHLFPGESAPVVLSSVSTGEGSHRFTCYTSLPNGEPEGYTFNDTIQSNFFSNVFTPPISGVYEGFDGNGFPQEGWTLSSSTINQWGETSLTRYEGSGAGVMNNYLGFEPFGEHYDLELPLLNISGLFNTDFSFDYAYTNYPGIMSDSLQVSVSEDCGSTWETLFYKGGYTLRTASPSYETFYPDSPEEWKHESFSLSGFDGNVLIRFRATLGYSNNLYIDNILVGSPVGVDEPAVGGQQSAVFCYPNPTSVSSQFAVRSSHEGHVTLKICDVQGREIAVLVDGNLPTGEHTLSFDMSGLPAGIYFYRLTVLQASPSGHADDRRLTTETGKIMKY